VIHGVAFPPVRLADRAENGVPCPGTVQSIARGEAANKLCARRICAPVSLRHPGFRSNLVPVQRWEDFQQFVLTPIATRTLVDSVPDTGPRLIDIAVLGG